MLTFKIIRKIGKILRGGAGRKEIFLGTLFGVLIGFCPDFNLTLLVTFLLALLLNANFSFVVLGAAMGKLLSLPMAAVSFHIGYTLIHNLGMEGLFRSLCNAPVTALMGLNIYAMVGGLPIALVAGAVLGLLLGTTVVKIRKKMLDADQHEIIGKAFGNKVSRLLLRLAFGKSKLSLDDEIPQQAPWLRKSGLIIVGSLVVILLVFEFLLLDIILRKGMESAIASQTGAEVNISSAHFSLAKGEIGIVGLQVTDPDKPTHNMLQIGRLTADVAIGELLSRNYEIDLLAGSMLQHDVPRKAPGAVYETPEKMKKEKPAEEDAPGKSLDDYFAQAEKWKKYGRKAQEYLKKRKENAESASQDKAPKPSKEAAVADAERLGYLKAAADLYADRPAWTILKVEIDDVDLGKELPMQRLLATDLSSHPELRGKPTRIVMIPEDDVEPTAELVLRFDKPDADHAIQINLPGVAIGEAFETSGSFPVDVRDGVADIHIAGKFSASAINLPFSLVLHNLKASVEEGQQVMGMDSTTATEVLSSMETLEIDGSLDGPLMAPRVSIDYEKLTANTKEALVAAGKKELSNRANAEMDKAKDELKKQASQEINKLMGGEEGESTTDKAKDALKKLF